MIALLCEYTTCCLKSVKRFEGTAEYQILEINLNTAWGVFFFSSFFFQRNKLLPIRVSRHVFCKMIP